MQRSNSHDPNSTPRLRRRRLLRRFNLLSILLMLLIAICTIMAYTAHSSAGKEGAQEEDNNLPDQNDPEGGREPASDDEEAFLAVPAMLKDADNFLSEMTRRMEAVKNVCRTDASNIKPTPVMLHIVADTKEQFLYCVLPHPASGARLAHQLLLSDLWSPQFDDQGGLKQNQYSPPKDFELEQHEALFRTRFLVTRHPLQRLLDSYTSKFENGNDAKYYNAYGKTMVSYFRERPRDMSAAEVAQLLSKVDDDSEREQTLGNLYANPKGPTFTEFVEYVVNATFPDDVLWRPMHDHCAMCSIHYNYILSYEDLDTEGDQLMFLLKASFNENQKKENAFVGPPSEEASCSYFSQLRNKLRQSLMRKYDIEMRMFNYSKDPYMMCADEYVRQ